MISLEESKKRQYEHFIRSGNAARTTMKPTPERTANENKSYKSLYDAIDIPPSKNIKVLDLGCQTGEAYRKVLKVYDYYGIELIEEVAQMAIKEGTPNVEIGYIEELSKHYPPNTFDIIWARHVLEHATDLGLVIREIRKVSKPNAVLAFIVPCGFHNEPAHITEATKEGWEILFKDLGIKILKSWQHNFNLDEFCGIATF